MRKLFIHQPLFRIFSPVFSGVIVYLLVLLINNNVAQIQEQFLGEELYVFIGLSYITQEAVRLLLWLLRRKKHKPNAATEIATQLILSILLCIVIVSVSMTLFYQYIEGYSINFDELLVFNSIFAVISFIYVLLFVSHQYLYKINSEKLHQEELIRQNIEDEFLQFKREINPALLFDSLESLLVLIEKNEHESEEFIDHLSVLYRYILNKKEKQLVSVKDELLVCKELLLLLDELPLRSLEIEEGLDSDFLLVPGSLLSLIEVISRTTILSNHPLRVSMKEQEDYFVISYATNDRITKSFQESDLNDIKNVYSIYTEKNISIKIKGGQRIIQIPKLRLG